MELLLIFYGIRYHWNYNIVQLAMNAELLDVLSEAYTQWRMYDVII